MMRLGHRIGRLGVRWILGALLVLILAACRSEVAEAPAPADRTTSSAAPVAAGVVAADALPEDQALPPVRLQIPAIELDVPVESMGWQVIVVADEKRTEWVIPEAAAGWHINSAGAGGDGNVVLSGHQVAGSAVFAPLSLGEIAAGQEVLLTDEEGVTFAYRITEVTEPIPVAGASEEESLAAAAYIGPTDTARLTLVTGWPDFTTTHRVFALADLVGVTK